MRKHYKRAISVLTCAALLFAPLSGLAPSTLSSITSYAGANDFKWSSYKSKSASWWSSSEATGIADEIVQYQLSDGGWPQVFNDAGTYHAHITYNDNAMVEVLNIMQEIAKQSSDFAFVDSTRREKAVKAVDKGIQCILNTQVISGGVKTAWGQHHDEFTLAPAGARAYEVPSICTQESVGIVNFLLALENPSTEVKQAINSAIVWMQKSQLNGIKIVSENGDKKVVEDKNADPLWARFYELETNKPIFEDRDSSVHYDWTEISQERRTGYSWYGTWCKDLVKKSLLPVDEQPQTTIAAQTITTTTTIKTTTTAATTTAPVQTTAPAITDSDGIIKLSGGWFETAYAEWDKVSGADSYNV